MRPKVTVLMPVYNGEKYLKEAITSILSQTFNDFEFLIIDDGSTDSSVDIINSYSDYRINLVRNSQNHGLIYTLNKGLDIAKGDYIARMDCDDISAPERLQKQVLFLDENSSVDICGSWIHSFGENINNLWKTKANDGEIRSELIFNSSIAHATVVFRNKSLSKYNLRYNDRHQHAEDYGLWVSATRFLKFANLQEALYKYRRHGQNVTIQCDHIQHASVNLIQREYLIESGVKFTPNEFKLHSEISKCKFQCTQSFVQQADKWLLKLLEANKQCLFLPLPSFSKILAERWYRICREGQELGLWTWKKFWDSPLSQHIHISLKNYIGFLIKSSLKKG